MRPFGAAKIMSPAIREQCGGRDLEGLAGKVFHLGAAVGRVAQANGTSNDYLEIAQFQEQPQ